MKKLISTALAATMVLSSFAAIASEDSIRVLVDGSEVKFEQAPIIVEERTLVPLRAIFEALGAKVNYVAETKNIFVNKRNDFIQLTVGSKDLVVNGETKQLEVPAQTLNDTTLVPVRAISESLSAKVGWDEKSKTISIESKQYDHFIKDEYISYQEKAEDGTVILDMTAYYPKIVDEKNDPVITKLNEKFKNDAQTAIDNMKKENTKDSKEFYATVKDDETRPWHAFTFDRFFDINYDINNLLSMTVTDSIYLGGAHPSHLKTSATYNMADGSKLEKKDIFAKTDPEINEVVKALFLKDMDTNKEIYFEDSKDTIKPEDAQFYLSENGIVFFYNNYDIAPYSSGMPSVTMPYEGNESTFKMFLKKNDKPLKITLDGNPTTGYMWNPVSYDKNIVLVSDYDYQSDKSAVDGMAGTGGTFTFNVYGLKEGKTTISFSYMRDWEETEKSAQTKEFKVEVLKDGTVQIEK